MKVRSMILAIGLFIATLFTVAGATTPAEPTFQSNLAVALSDSGVEGFETLKTAVDKTTGELDIVGRLPAPSWGLDRSLSTETLSNDGTPGDYITALLTGNGDKNTVFV